MISERVGWYHGARSMSWTVAPIASGAEKQWISSPASLPTISAPRIRPVARAATP